MSPSHSQSHLFHTGNNLGERRTRLAVYLTAIMMVAEIFGGWWFGSMALLADGWHMSSHALALGLASFAFWLSRKYAQDHRFSMGTWKIEILAAFASSIMLIGIAALMIFQSVERLISPSNIQYNQAIGVAVLGLLVNLVCAKLLHQGQDDHTHLHDHHEHSHEHVSSHSHGHHHSHTNGSKRSHDLNMRAAYIHVLTDAATSVFAIVALIAGKFWGLNWMDPVMGLVGAILVGTWAKGLLIDTGKILADAEMDAPVGLEIREAIAAGEPTAEITDLHLWRVAKDKFACMLTLNTMGDLDPDRFKRMIQIHEELVHITVETHPK